LDKHFADRAAAEAQEAAEIEERRKTTQIAESAQANRPSVNAINTSVKPVEKSAEIIQIKSERPSDKELIELVAQNFNVSFGVACDWIIEAVEAMKEAA